VFKDSHFYDEIKMEVNEKEKKIHITKSEAPRCRYNCLAQKNQTVTFILQPCAVTAASMYLGSICILSDE